MKKHIENSKKECAIVPLSSGLDSTYLLYKVLNETKKDVFVIHVNLIKPQENYHTIEMDRSNRIIKILKNKFPNRIKDFKKPSIDLTSFPIGLDTDGVLVLCQKFCYDLVKMRRYHSIQLYIGLVPDDGEYARFRNKFKKDGMNNRIWSCLLDSMIRRVDHIWWEKIDHKIQYPLYWEEISKSDILNLMPSYLKELVWCCRTPINGEPCKKCKSCVLHHQSIMRSKNDKL